MKVRRAGRRSWLAATLLVPCCATAAGVKVEPYGTTRDGRAVKAYTLLNDRGASATILDYGGTVAAVRVPDRTGSFANVVMAFQDLAGWEAGGHVNAITGRYANIIVNGFTLDGVHYPLNPDARGVTMHGGVAQYARRIWKVAPLRPRDGAAITLSLESPDGDQGFPGTLQIAVKYSLTDRDELRLDFTATTDRATVLNLTNHIYFNLSGNGVVPVYDHVLQVMTDQAGSRTPGKLADSVVGTPFDFTRPDQIREHSANALGQQYDVADTSPPVPPGMTRGFNEPYLLHDGDNRLDRVAARLFDPATGRILEVRTTEISVHVFMPSKGREDALSDSGKPFTRGPAIAFETQHLPDSPNRPEFPTTVLRPGKTFGSTTIFAFTTDVRGARPGAQ
jgi:aldose 1-epimerase